MPPERANRAVPLVAVVAHVKPRVVFARRPGVARAVARAACGAERRRAGGPGALAARPRLLALAPAAPPLSAGAPAPVRAEPAHRFKRRLALVANELTRRVLLRRPFVARAEAAGTDGAERGGAFRSRAFARRLVRLALAPAAPPLAAVASLRAVRGQPAARTVRVLAVRTDEDFLRVGIDADPVEEVELAALAHEDFALQQHARGARAKEGMGRAVSRACSTQCAARRSSRSHLQATEAPNACDRSGDLVVDRESRDA